MKGNWTRTINMVEGYLGNCLGVTKVPLAYVIRNDQEPREEDPEEGYANKSEELIARVPHFRVAPNDTEHT